MNRAVFLDRDGVINSMVETPLGIDSPQHPDEFRILEGAAPAVRDLNQLGLAIVVVSNQPGIAKGKSTPEHLWATTDLMHEMVGAEGARLDAVYYCLHHPQATITEYRAVCDCRKPMPGLLLRAAEELDICLAASYMVGDQPSDMVAGKAAGCTTVLVPAHGGLIDPPAEADYVCDGLPAAARLIAELETRAPQLLELPGGGA